MSSAFFRCASRRWRGRAAHALLGALAMAGACMAVAAPPFVQVGWRAATSAASAASNPRDRAGNTVAESDRLFLQRALQAGSAEVALGRLGLEQGRRPEVRAFGAAMVRDHGRSNQELQQLAVSKGLTLDEALDPSLQRDLDRLSRLSDAEFDRAFMTHMVESHRQAVADFGRTAKQSRDPQVKGFATQTLPVLRQHLRHAQTTLQQLGRSGATAESPQ